jgi:hypothetical protein
MKIVQYYLHFVTFFAGYLLCDLWPHWTDSPFWQKETTDKWIYAICIGSFLLVALIMSIYSDIRKMVKK